MRTVRSGMVMGAMRLCALMGAALLVAGAPCSGQSVRLTDVFNSSAPKSEVVPSGARNPVCYGQGWITFHGKILNPYSYGVFQLSPQGELVWVAQGKVTFVPGLGIPTSFQYPSAENRDLAFYAKTAGITGSFARYVNGELEVVARERNYWPTTNPLDFTTLSAWPDMSNGQVVFVGQQNQLIAIYLFEEGTTRALTDPATTSIPGHPNTKFSEFGYYPEPSIDRGFVAFEARTTGGWNGHGIFMIETLSGEVRIVISNDEIAPGLASLIENFKNPTIRGQSVAFQAREVSGVQGIYTNRGIEFELVADAETKLPGSSAMLGKFATAVAFDGQRVVFGTSSSGNSMAEGVYIDAGVGLRAIVRTGDLIDGREVASLILGNRAMADSSIVMTANYTDNTIGIVLGEICGADCDLSTGPGTLDVFDFLCFQNEFAQMGSYACNYDMSSGRMVCDIFDFLAFQQDFLSGCP